MIFHTGNVRRTLPGVQTTDKYIFYHKLAPAKYASVGREYRYSLPETKKS